MADYALHGTGSCIILTTGDPVGKRVIDNKNVHIPDQLKEIADLRKANNHKAVLQLLYNLIEKKRDSLEEHKPNYLVAARLYTRRQCVGL